MGFYTISIRGALSLKLFWTPVNPTNPIFMIEIDCNPIFEEKRHGMKKETISIDTEFIRLTPSSSAAAPWIPEDRQNLRSSPAVSG